MKNMKKMRINKSYLLFCFLLFFVAVSYSNTLYSPFVLDDYSSFINNKDLYLKDFSFESFAKLAHTRFGLARVIPIASFALNHYISQGESIVSYHLTNIVIHLLATISLAFLLAGLLKTRGIQGRIKFFRPEYFILAVCGFWALSPLQTNAVTYVVQRMTSMAALFYIASCGFYIHARLAGANWKRIILYTFSLLAAAFAFLSKENSATLPASLLLIEFFFITPDLGSRLLRSSRWYHWFVILIGVILVFPLIENFVNGQIGQFYGRHFTLSERLLTELRIVVFYMSLLLLPLSSRMNLEHDISLSTSFLSPPTTFFALLLIVGLLAAAIFYRKKYPLISFGIFWYFLNLIIESSFIPLELIFEHRAYLPSVGFFIVLISLFDHLLARYGAESHPEIKKIVFLLFIMVLSASSILTSLRNNDWRDKLALHRDSMEKSPANARVVSNYALALGRAGQYEECVEWGLKVQSLGEQGYEDYMSSATNVLSCLILQEDYKEAARVGEQIKSQIIQKNMAYIQAVDLYKYMSNMARAYTEEKQYRKAYEYFQMALFRAPHEAKTYLAVNRMLLLAQEDEQGRRDLNLGEGTYEVPIKLFQTAFNYRQYDYAKLYLDDVVKLGAGPEVIKPLEEKLTNTVKQNKSKAYESTIENDLTYKDNLQFRLYLKTVDFILRKYRPLRGAVAGWLINRAQTIDPDNPFLPVYRARWHKANNRVNIAISELEEFTEINKNFVPVLDFLGKCYRDTKNYEKAVSVFSHILDVYPGHRAWANYLSYIYQYEDRVNEKKRSPLEYY